MRNRQGHKAEEARRCHPQPGGGQLAPGHPGRGRRQEARELETGLRGNLEARSRLWVKWEGPGGSGLRQVPKRTMASGVAQLNLGEVGYEDAHK